MSVLEFAMLISLVALSIAAVFSKSNLLLLATIVWSALVAQASYWGTFLVFVLLPLYALYIRKRRVQKILLDRVLEKYPIQMTLLLAGAGRIAIARVPYLPQLIGVFSYSLAREIQQNPIGKLETMISQSAYSELKRLFYASDVDSLKSAIPATIGRVLGKRHQRAMITARVTGVLLLALTILPAFFSRLPQLFALLAQR